MSDRPNVVAADVPEPYSAEVGLRRHIEQAHAISHLLEGTGLGPCSLVEGVQALVVRLTQAESALAAARAEVNDLRAAILAYVEADKRDAWTTAEVVSLAKAHADDSQTLDEFEEESRDETDTYDEVVAQRDAARAAVKAWEDKEASRGMCCWQMEKERDAARAEAARLREALGVIKAFDAWRLSDASLQALSHLETP